MSPVRPYWLQHLQQFPQAVIAVVVALVTLAAVVAGVNVAGAVVGSL